MTDLDWQERKTSHGVYIDGAATHVWLLPCNRTRDALDELYRLLDDTERRRAQRYHFERDRDRFVAARGAVRRVLAGYLCCDPSEVCFDLTENGKPHLAAQHASSIRFNISTSCDWSLLAVAHGQEVGIDIERIDRDRADPAIVDQCFTPAEARALAGLQGDLWLQGFFNCWSRKEAFVKVTGEGLSRSLQSFEVTVVPGQRASLISVHGYQDAASKWQMSDLAEVPGYASTLVVAGRINELYNFRWSPL